MLCVVGFSAPAWGRGGPTFLYLIMVRPPSCGGRRSDPPCACDLLRPVLRRGERRAVASFSASAAGSRCHPTPPPHPVPRPVGCSGSSLPFAGRRGAQAQAEALGAVAELVLHGRALPRLPHDHPRVLARADHCDLLVVLCRSLPAHGRHRTTDGGLLLPQEVSACYCLLAAAQRSIWALHLRYILISVTTMRFGDCVRWGEGRASTDSGAGGVGGMMSGGCCARL